MSEKRRNMPCVKNFEDFFKKYKIDSYITTSDLSPYAIAEDLDNYVKTADIVNDLTTGGASKPLSAGMRKTLCGLSLYIIVPHSSNSEYAVC